MDSNEQLRGFEIFQTLDTDVDADVRFFLKKKITSEQARNYQWPQHDSWIKWTSFMAAPTLNYFRMGQSKAWPIVRWLISELLIIIEKPT